MLEALRVLDDGRKIKVRASRDLPRDATYICKHCGGRVILKKGKIRIPHFAHYPGEGTNCVAWEPETTDHILGKKFMRSLLWDFAKYSEYERNMKKYYPDVYVRTKDNHEIAVEIQCSRKPVKEVIRKTMWYSKHGIYTLWVLAWNRFVGGTITYSKAEQELMNSGISLNYRIQDKGVITGRISNLEELLFKWMGSVYYFQIYSKGKIRLLKVAFAPIVRYVEWISPYDDDTVWEHTYITKKKMNVKYMTIPKEKVRPIFREISWKNTTLRFVELSPIRVSAPVVETSSQYYADSDMLEEVW